ncbi:MAG: hypothetical protein IPK78_19580 [Rhodospirillales bacterium]|nr:hypothetical protein [Rhodospirillales bacterium]
MTGELSALHTFADVRAMVAGARRGPSFRDHLFTGAAFRFRLQAREKGRLEAAAGSWEQALLTAARGVQRTQRRRVLLGNHREQSKSGRL